MCAFPRRMVGALLATVLLVLVVATTACIGSGNASSTNGQAASGGTTVGSRIATDGRTDCRTPRVQYTPYPGHGNGLGRIPWIRGEPAGLGLVALLWYWPPAWARGKVEEARIFTGGVAPAGYNVKVLWVFLGHAARGAGGRDLVIRGRRLDEPGSFRSEPFSVISDVGRRGAPSYASIVNVPRPGCWRLSLATGSLAAHVDLWAVPGRTS